jgi:phosphatidylserine decarboxylase
MKMSLSYILLYLLPKNCLSRLIGALVSLRLPAFLTRFANRRFAGTFSIDLSEAAKPIEAYPTLQEFFIRELKAGLRPVDADAHALVSPCDGFLSVSDRVDGDRLMQIKGNHYRISDLLGDADLAARFFSGHHATLYLSPKDYHRFHAPVDGEIIRSYYIPGRLWPVNRWAVSHVDQLFCQNERVVSIIRENKTNRLLAHVAVGACVVGKIALTYAPFDQYEKYKGGMRAIDHKPMPIAKGQELGKFMFGSTIVLLMETGLMTSFAKEAPAHVKMGEILGNLLLAPSRSSERSS